jgi:chemotaxis protein MotB
MIQTLEWTDKGVRFLDQTKLPTEEIYVTATTYQQVADVIRNDKELQARSFQVAGHTDNKPLAGGPYRDNWGLSVMRAREVLSFLVAPVEGKNGGGGLPPDHWSAAGYGDTDPVVANDNPEGMQKNRRVELVVVPNVEEMLDLKSLTK